MEETRKRGDWRDWVVEDALEQDGEME